MSIKGGEKAVVMDLMKASGKHVLEESADELHHRQAHRLPSLLAGIFVAEGNLAVTHGEDAIVGDGNL